MIVKSIVAKLQNKYHVSAAEIDEQDVHQSIVIGVAAIVPHNALADSLMDEISMFVEENCEAEILDFIQHAKIGFYVRRWFKKMNNIWNM